MTPKIYKFHVYYRINNGKQVCDGCSKPIPKQAGCYQFGDKTYCSTTCLYTAFAETVKNKGT